MVIDIFCVARSYSSLLNCLDTFPSTAQPLLPQADSVVASADGQHVTAETPAYTPCGGVDVEDSGFPVF